MKYGSKVAARVEELLREQLEELGENPGAIDAHEIAAHMRCEIWSDDTMIYIWKETPILRVSSEQHDDGSVTWRMFTRDDEGDGFAADPAGSLTRDDGPLLDMSYRTAGGMDDDEDDDDDLDEDILSALLDDEDSGNDDLGDDEDEDDEDGNGGSDERRNGGYPVQ
ncbi:hypothetical protein [Nitratidesulfovibrio liaohensis]|uniref:hypothetical protein n=1 Tax=Nitratidesulfovibrio liaohensis TaxID=2604158 RepID=UPI00141F5232|nr:hypothetical protein [Nitratidesulfovibrio liaohensis]NHZ46771.1 hypothetical protein [Nitratidesulfovibrio liaohensis]